MKTTFISKENNQVKFTMDFTAEEFEAAVVKAYQASKNQFMIDGFRKGKAPRSIIEKHYGEGIFFEDAINNLFQESYPQAIRELQVEETVQTVEAEAVEKEIEMLQKRNARMVVAERPVEDGDTVILDYSGFVGEEQFEGGTAERQELKIGSGMFIPGFEEQLVGVKAGEDKDVNVTFPEEYHAPELAGKEAVFHCHIHEVKVEELPVLDDEFAKDVSEYDTLDELKKATEERLQTNADAMALNAAKDAVIEKVYEANKPEVPAVMVEDEIDRMAQELDHQLRYQGLSLEQYLQFLQKEPKDFREELREDAAKKVGTRLVLMSIVEAEKVEVSEEELETELKDMANAYNTDVEQIREMIGTDNLTFFKKDIQLKKVIDMLYDKAKVSKVEKKAEEPKEA